MKTKKLFQSEQVKLRAEIIRLKTIKVLQFQNTLIFAKYESSGFSNAFCDILFWLWFGEMNCTKWYQILISFNVIYSELYGFGQA